MILAEIMDETIRRDGGPAGVVNLVHGFGESAGKALTKHPAIKAIAASGRKIAVLASGSMSHKLIANDKVGDNQWGQVGSEFNRQVDLRVLDLWKERRYAESVRMLPEYSAKCNGEGLMVDTHMIFGLLGWDKYAGETEILCPYFPSSGSGQVVCEYHLS